MLSENECVQLFDFLCFRIRKHMGVNIHSRWVIGKAPNSKRRSGFLSCLRCNLKGRLGRQAVTRVSVCPIDAYPPHNTPLFYRLGPRNMARIKNTSSTGQKIHKKPKNTKNTKNRINPKINPASSFTYHLLKSI